MRSRSHSGGVVHVSPLLSHSFTYRKRACKWKTCILSSCLCVGCLIRKRNIFFFSKNKMVQDIYLFIFVWLFGLYHATEYAGMWSQLIIVKVCFSNLRMATWCNTCTMQVWGLPVNTLKPTKRLGLGLRGESVRGAKRCKWVKSVVEPWCNQMLILFFLSFFLNRFISISGIN